MRHYSIFLLNEDVATDYFGKESLLYHLFHEHNYRYRREAERRNILEMQVNYIIRKIPVTALKQSFETLHAASGNLIVEGNQYKLNGTSSKIKSFATLTLFPQVITLSAKGSFEAETTFFECLRKIDPCFLAMDFNANRFGWLNPIKQRKYV